nr:MAG TPA: chitin synthase regulator [Inoviridae sp.]
MDLFPLPEMRYVFGLILISLNLFFLLMFFYLPYL